jgi:PAS domain S-box-containing protein
MTGRLSKKSKISSDNNQSSATDVREYLQWDLGETIPNEDFEQALQENQARLNGIIASAMDAIITVDQNQRIILFNRAAEQMFGYQSDKVLGKPLDNLLPERFRARHRQEIQRFGETGVTNRSMGKLGTLYGLRSNGHEFQIEASISQVEVSGGKLYSVILRDVTERVAAEERLVESEQQLKAEFEQAAVGIAHLTPDGRWVRANPKLYEILGYSADELRSKTLMDLTHPDDLQKDLELQQRLLSGELQSYVLEKRFIRLDGSSIWANVTVSLVKDLRGEIKYLIKIVEDITERKKAEAALKTKNDELKAMTQQLWQTAKLATMGELSASVAHELNNPLAILSLRIELLKGSIPESSQQMRELEIMEQEVDRMASLVSNLLQFSRSGQRQISTLDVRQEADSTLELVHNLLVHRHIAVQRDFSGELPLLQADRQQLRQLFLNLFSNAADAMPQGGTLTIRITPAEQGRMVAIEITDTGTGIHPDHLRLIMEPFFTTKAEGKGTGLGLSICKRIVEEHKGSIHISSPGIGKGATILIQLPSANSSPPNFWVE